MRLARLSRRARRRLTLLVMGIAIASVAALTLRTVRALQQERLVEQARHDGLSAYADGDLDLALLRLSYVFEHRKDDLEVNTTFADARARKPLAGGQHLLEAADLYTTHGLNLLDRSSRGAEADARRREILERLLKVYGQLGLRLEILRTADQILALEPEHLDALGVKAEVLYFERQLDEAAPLVDRLIIREPNNLNWRRLTLQIRTAAGAPQEELVDQCRQWAAGDAVDGRFRLLLASMLIQQDRDDEARTELLAACEMGAQSPEVLQRLVTLLDLLNLRDESERLLSRSRLRLPRQSWVREVAASRAWRAGLTDRALVELEEAQRDLGQLDPGLRKLQILALIGESRIEQAQAAIQELIGASKDRAGEADRAWAHAVSTAIKSDEKDWRQSVDALSIALSLSPTDPVLHQLMGDVCARVGEYGQATQAYRQAHELDPDWMTAGLTYADTLLKLGRLEEAYQVAQIVVSRSAENRVEPAIMYARAYLALRAVGGGSQVVAKDAQSAAEVIVMLERLAVQMPDDPVVVGLLVDALAEEGAKERAQDVIAQVLARQEHASVNMALELASVSMEHQLGCEKQLLEHAAANDRASLPIAVLEARRLANDGDAAAGLRLIESVMAQASLTEEQMRHAECELTAFAVQTGVRDPANDLKRLVEQYPNSAQVQRFVLAQPPAWSDVRLIAQAMHNLKSALGAQSPQVRLAEANFLLRHHADNPAMLARAITQINDVLEHSPDSLAALSLRAEALMMGAQPDLHGAISTLEHAAGLYPAEPSLPVRLISLLQLRGDFDRAGHYLQILARMTERRPELRQAELRLLYTHGDFESALVRAAALVNESSPPSEQLVLATIHHRAGNLAEAEGIYQRLLALPDADDLVRSQAAEFYASTGRFDQGLQLIKAVEPAGGPAARFIVIGAFFQRYGRSDEACTQLLRAVEADPRSADARYELARHYLDGQDRAAAREQAMKGLELASHNQALQALLAVASLGDGADRPAAIATLRELGAGDSDLVEALLVLEQVPYRDGRPAPTDTNLSAAYGLVENHGRFLPAWLLAVTLHAEAGRKIEAVNLARRAVSRFPASSEPSQWATQLLMQACRWNDALVEAQEWRRRAVHDPLAVDTVIASILLELNKPQHAYEQLAPRAAQIVNEQARRPERLEVWIRTLAWSGRFGQAVQFAPGLLESDARWRQAWLDIAARLNGDEASRALTMLDSVKVEEPSELLAIAAHWTQLGRWANRSDWLGRADELAVLAGNTPAFAVQSLVARGAIAEAGGDLPAAEEFYRQALQREPQNPLALNNLACLLARTPARCLEALSMVEDALSRAPSQPDLLDTYGQVLLNLDRAVEAEQVLRQALEARPDDMGIGLNLAETLVRQGRPDDATELLDELRRRLLIQPRPDPRHRTRLDLLREQAQDLQTVAQHVE